MRTGPRSRIDTFGGVEASIGDEPNHGSSSAVLARASSALTAKRIGTGDALDRWYPYYAGYSQHFAAEVLAELCGASRQTVLDPWNGSGTTTAAAFHGGHTPIGFDLNPATLVIANAKLASRADLDALPANLDRCFRVARRNLETTRHPDADPLGLWLSPRVVAFSRQAFAWLSTQTNCQITDIPPRFSLVALCLLRALRDFAVDERSNASWTLPHNPIKPTRIASVERRALAIAEEFTMDRDLLPAEPSVERARLGDARSLGLPSASVDVILTSPPYCTRIDYAKQTGFELAALLRMDQEKARALRDGLMGTTTIRQPRRAPCALPRVVLELLREIRSHESHRSAAYYHRNLKQYFQDASLAMAEIARVLRPGGRAVLVLQNSYYKEILIPLSDLYCALGNSRGLDSRVAARKGVTKSMTQMNARAKKYRATRSYTEDLVLMERTS